MEHLEALNNKELRAECLKYGLNVPITDSSRDVIIRKLRKMVMGPAAASPKGQKKTKRQTVHTSRSEDVEIESPRVDQNRNRNKAHISPGRVNKTHNKNVSFGNKSEQHVSPTRINQNTHTEFAVPTTSPSLESYREKELRKTNLPGTGGRSTLIGDFAASTTSSSVGSYREQEFRGTPLPNRDFAAPATTPGIGSYREQEFRGTPLPNRDFAAPATTPGVGSYREQDPRGGKSKLSTNFAVPPTPPSFGSYREQEFRETTLPSPTSHNYPISPKSRVRIIPMEIEGEEDELHLEYRRSGPYTSNYNFTVKPTQFEESPQPQLPKPLVTLSQSKVMTTDYGDDTLPPLSVQPPCSPPSVCGSSYSRSSRSTSLSKSGVMTTSYRQEYEPLTKSHNDDDYDQPDTHVDYTYKGGSSDAYDRSTYHSLMQQSNTKKLPFEPLATKQTFRDSLNSTSYSAYGGNKNNNNSNSNPYIRGSNNSPLSAASRKSATTAVKKANKVAAPAPKLYPNLSSFNSQLTASEEEDEDEEMDMGISNTKVDEINDDVDTDDASNDEETIETPYFSKFTQKLENIKADNLSHGQVEFRKNKRISQYSKLTPAGRRAIVEDEADVADSFRKFLADLNFKYHLKEFFVMFLIFSLAIFVYTVFLQETQVN